VAEKRYVLGTVEKLSGARGRCLVATEAEALNPESMHSRVYLNGYVSIRSLEERNHEWQHSTAPAKTFSRNSIFG
jgi:hypothetical protein